MHWLMGVGGWGIQMLRRRAELADLANWIFYRLEKAKLRLSACFYPCTWEEKMGIRLLGHNRSPRSPWMNASPLSVSEALYYANIQPMERAWQRTALGNPAGPCRGPELYAQPVSRFFKLLPKPWHGAPGRNLALILFDKGRSHKFKCLWGPGRQHKGVKRPGQETGGLGKYVPTEGSHPSASPGCYQEQGPWMARAFDISRKADNLNFYVNSLDLKCWH